MTYLSPRTALPGFTLLELLVSTAIFTVILGSLMAVLISLQKADLFRDRYSIVTQAERSAYEPIVRAVKAANAEESIFYGGQCITVRGFYFIDGGIAQPTFEATNINPTLRPLQPGQILATVTAEDTYDQTNGPSKKWVKREFQLSPHPDNSLNQTIKETTYHQAPGFEWPKPLKDQPGSCTVTSYLGHWIQDSGNPLVLTVPKASIVKFGLRMAADQRNSSGAPSTFAPFLSLEVAAAYADRNICKGQANDPCKTIPTLTLRSTVTPTFTYGVIHD